MNKEIELKLQNNTSLSIDKTFDLTNEIKDTQQKTEKKAFTLLELLVVILILGILAAAVVPQVIGASDKAKVDLVCVQMKGASEALKMFKMDNGIYPETDEGFGALQSNPDSDKYPNYSSKGYLEKFPKDSWGAKLVYVKVGNKFDIYSYGADRREGGTEEAADLKFSECK